MLSTRKFFAKIFGFWQDGDEMDIERFWPIQGFPNYEVSDQGRVVNITTGRIMAITRQKTTDWYVVGLMRDGHQTVKGLARLVAEAFLEDPVEPNMSVIHRDGNRANNQVWNLAWRPRWFVVRYMREMQDPLLRSVRPFQASLTGVIFQSIAECCQETLLLPSTIQTSLGGLVSVYFPEHGQFEYV